MVYKGVEPTRVTLAQQPMRLTIWLSNVGNSPAVGVLTTSTILVSRVFPLPPPYNPTVPTISNPYPEVRSETVVGPKGDFGTYAILQNISPQLVDAINSARSTSTCMVASTISTNLTGADTRRGASSMCRSRLKTPVTSQDATSTTPSISRG
jgi:hypothetical protein